MIISGDKATTCGFTLIPETDTSPTHLICLAYTPVPSNFTINRTNSGRTYTYITAIRTDLDVISSGETVLETAIVDLENGLLLATLGELQSEHKMAWKQLWEHAVYIENRPELALSVNASLFAILSSVRADWPYGLAPGGLTNYYNGHSFWDTGKV